MKSLLTEPITINKNTLIKPQWKKLFVNLFLNTKLFSNITEKISSLLLQCNFSSSWENATRKGWKVSFSDNEIFPSRVDGWLLKFLKMKISIRRNAAKCCRAVELKSNKQKQFCHCQLNGSRQALFSWLLWEVGAKRVHKRIQIRMKFSFYFFPLNDDEANFFYYLFAFPREMATTWK